MSNTSAKPAVNFAAAVQRKNTPSNTTNKTSSSTAGNKDKNTNIVPVLKPGVSEEKSNNKPSPSPSTNIASQNISTTTSVVETNPSNDTKKEKESNSVASNALNRKDGPTPGVPKKPVSVWGSKQLFAPAVNSSPPSTATIPNKPPAARSAPSSPSKRKSSKDATKESLHNSDPIPMTSANVTSPAVVTGAAVVSVISGANRAPSPALTALPNSPVVSASIPPPSQNSAHTYSAITKGKPNKLKDQHVPTDGGKDHQSDSKSSLPSDVKNPSQNSVTPAPIVTQTHIQQPDSGMQQETNPSNWASSPIDSSPPMTNLEPTSPATTTSKAKRKKNKKNKARAAAAAAAAEAAQAQFAGNDSGTANGAAASIDSNAISHNAINPVIVNAPILNPTDGNSSQSGQSQQQQQSQHGGQGGKQPRKYNQQRRNSKQFYAIPNYPAQYPPYLPDPFNPNYPMYPPAPHYSPVILNPPHAVHPLQGSPYVAQVSPRSAAPPPTAFTLVPLPPQPVPVGGSPVPHSNAYYYPNFAPNPEYTNPNYSKSKRGKAQLDNANPPPQQPLPSSDTNNANPQPQEQNSVSNPNSNTNNSNGNNGNSNSNSNIGNNNPSNNNNASNNNGNNNNYRNSRRQQMPNYQPSAPPHMQMVPLYPTFGMPPQGGPYMNGMLPQARPAQGYGPPPPYPTQPPFGNEFSSATEILIKQMEYYFSPTNLIRDNYLRGLMNLKGYVSLEKLATFNRIKMLTQRVSEVKRAAKLSSIFKVKNNHVRLREEWWKWTLPPQPEREKEPDSEEEQNDTNEEFRDFQPTLYPHVHHQLYYSPTQSPNAPPRSVRDGPNASANTSPSPPHTTINPNITPNNPNPLPVNTSTSLPTNNATNNPNTTNNGTNTNQPHNPPRRNKNSNRQNRNNNNANSPSKQAGDPAVNVTNTPSATVQ